MGSVDYQVRSGVFELKVRDQTRLSNHLAVLPAAENNILGLHGMFTKIRFDAPRLQKSSRVRGNLYTCSYLMSNQLEC